tara:strand:+ start:214 stop:669 length:456 start_codon:yes stop_codon:yes gene_type:complete
MGYRQSKSYSRYNNRYATTGGYDSTGRWRSEAWHMDGGANDEGWHYRYCGTCGTETEHARGGGCVSCDNRAIRQQARKNRKNPAQSDRKWIFSLYEKRVEEGERSSFIQSLKEQNEVRCLSAKQVDVGMKILSKHIDAGTLRSYWVAAHRK